MENEPLEREEGGNQATMYGGRDIVTGLKNTCGGQLGVIPHRLDQTY